MSNDYGPDFAAPKLREWQRSVPVRSSQFPKLPIITFQDLPASQKDRIKGWYHTRDWEKCSGPECPRSGSQYIMKKCAGCGTIPASRTYYCSRRCQRANWPEHKDICKRRYLEWKYHEATKEKQVFIIWSNWMPVQAKRQEGLALIWHWVFNQVLLSCPNINLRKQCLSVRCLSSELGRGFLFPLSYRLEPIDKYDSSDLASQVDQWHPSLKMGIIVVHIDDLPLTPQLVDLRTSESPYLIEQWPWIFATIVAKRNRNRQLSSYRLQHLYPIVEQLALMKRPEVLHFRGPKNLDNGEEWRLYDVERWRRLFRDRKSVV